MSTSVSKYTAMDADALDAQGRAIGFDTAGNYYKWKDGMNILRFFPGKGGLQPFVQFHKHFVKGAVGGKAWGGPCPLQMAKQPCPVCRIASLLSRGVDTDREMAKDIEAKKRVLTVALDRSAPDAGAQLVEMGPGLYKQLVQDIFKTLGEDFTDPETGFDIQIFKTGQGLKTEYKAEPLRSNKGKGAVEIKPIHQDAEQMDEWLASAPDLASQVVVPTEPAIMIRLADTIIAGMLKRSPAPAPAAKLAPGTKKQLPAADADADDDLEY